MLKCYIKNSSIYIKQNGGLLTLELQAVEVDGNTTYDQDWHAVEDLKVQIANANTMGKVNVQCAIDTTNHEYLKIGGSGYEFPEGNSVMSVTGRLGANCFGFEIAVKADANGTASLSNDITLKTLCVPEDGGVKSIGGATGAITLGDGLEIEDNELSVTLEQNLLIGTQAERLAYTGMVAGTQWNETGGADIVRYMYDGTAWVEIKGGNLLIGTQAEREALVNPAEGLEFNQVTYDSSTETYSVRRYIRENGQWIELESPQTQSNETVSLHVSTYDGQGVLTGLAVGVTDNTAQTSQSLVLDASGNCTFQIPKNHSYTISVADLAGYHSIPDETFRASMDERSINLVFQAATSNYETIIVQVTIKNAQGQDITSTDTDFVGLDVNCAITGGQTLTAQIGSNHQCQFQVPYGSVYTITDPTAPSGYKSQYQTTFSHTASIPQRYISMHYIVWAADGIYGVKADGSLYNYEAIEAMSSAEREEIIAVAINTSRLQTANAGFMYKLPTTTQGKQWADQNVEFDQSLLPYKSNHNAAILDLDGAGNTQKIISIGDSMSVETPAADYCYAQTLTIGGVAKNGFLGAYGQMYALSENIVVLNALHTLLGKAAGGFTSGSWWASTQASATGAVYLNNGGFGTNYKTGSNTSVALFAL